MNSWKVILATVVIFGAGVMTGGLLVNYVDHSHHPATTRPKPHRARRKITTAPTSIRRNRRSRKC